MQVFCHSGVPTTYEAGPCFVRTLIESSGVIQSLTEAKKIFVLTNQIRAVREMLDLFGLDRVSLETIQNMSEPDEEGTICFCAGAGSKEDHTFWTLTWTGGTIEMG